MIDNTQPEDRARVRALMAALRPGRPVVDPRDEPIILTHYAAPIPWARARTRGGVYFTDKRTKAAAADLGKAFALLPERPVGFANLALVCLFYMPTRQIVDTDNLVKLVMDAATKAHVWEDDSQVTAQTVVVEYCGAQPRATLTQARTVIGIAPTDSTLDRTIPLERRRRPSLPLAQITLAGR